MRSPSRADVLVPLLACLVEGAWIAVVDALFAAGARRPPLGPFTFGLVAAIGLLWVRRAAPDVQRPGLVAIAAIVFVGGAVIARGAEVFGDGFPVTLLAEPAAWLAAIALIRGTVHRDPEEDDVVVAELLRFGIPLLTIPWLLGVALPPTAHGAFVSAAFPATVLFAGGGLLALGLARLEALAIASGIDWRRNRAWLLLLGGVVLLVLAVAVPAALLIGEPMGQALAGLAGPFATLFTPITALVGLVLLPIIGAFVEFLQSLLRNFQGVVQEGGPLGPTGTFEPPADVPTQPSDLGAVLVTVLTVVAILAGLIVLARIARHGGRGAANPAALEEEHEFVPPSVSLRLPHLPRTARIRNPATATGAYLAFLAEAERAGPLARRPNEGPETHARRVGEEDLAAADRRAAALLAADYELERYALRDLPPQETRRALSRWQRLRDSLRSTRRSRR